MPWTLAERTQPAGQGPSARSCRSCLTEPMRATPAFPGAQHHGEHWQMTDDEELFVADVVSTALRAGAQDQVPAASVAMRQVRPQLISLMWGPMTWWGPGGQLTAAGWSAGVTVKAVHNARSTTRRRNVRTWRGVFQPSTSTTLPPWP